MHPTIIDSIAQLNPEQRAAVDAKGHALVTACPGSGKTKMLSVKAAMLLSNPANRVCVVTFSKDAAQELRDRTLALFGSAPAEIQRRLLSGTFHSICFRLLRTIREIDLKAILSSGESLDYAARVIANAGLELEPAEVLAAVERHRAEAPSLTQLQDKRIAEAYLAIMRTNGKVDFTDLVVEAITALDEGRVAPLNMTHVLVDEFQDTDNMQMRWIKHHSAAGAVVTVVGDDDQSIFSWRFALGYPGMVEFAKHHRAEEIVLGTNYRCRAEILGAAERLIVNNAARIPKALVAAKGSGGRITAAAFPRKDEEARSVVAALQDFAQANYSAAILARTNAALLDIAAALKLANIPYVAPAGADALTSAEAALLIDVCDYVCGTSNRGIEHMLSHTHFPSGDLKKMAKLLMFGAEIGPAKLRSLGVSEEGIAAAKLFSGSFLRLRSLYQQDRSRVDLMLAGVFSWLVEQAGWGETHVRYRRLDICMGVMRKLRGSLEERVRAFREMAKKTKDSPSERVVVCTTMHASKGLEWDRVFIVQANDGICPSGNSPVVDEERRLFYVAMTRARDALAISTAGGIASPFLAEAGIVPMRALPSAR